MDPNYYKAEGNRAAVTEDGGGARDDECRQPLEREKACKDRILSQWPLEGASPDTLIS